MLYMRDGEIQEIIQKTFSVYVCVQQELSKRLQGIPKGRFQDNFREATLERK